jgi:hypothetical protein
MFGSVGSTTRTINRFGGAGVTLMESGTYDENGLFKYQELISGLVTLSLDSELKAPGVSEPIALIFYVSAAPNFKLYRPIAFEKRIVNADPAWQAANPTLLARSNFLYDGMIAPAVDLQSSIERYKVHEFGTTDSDKLAHVVTSESITDLKTLLKTFMWHKWFNVYNASTTNTSAFNTNWNGYPWVPGYYGSNIGGVGDTATSASASTVASSGYISNSFGAATGTGEYNSRAIIPIISYTDTTGFGSATKPNRANFEACNLTYIPYITGMFCGHRGDIAWRIRINSNVVGNVAAFAQRSQVGFYNAEVANASSAINGNAFMSSILSFEGSAQAPEYASNIRDGLIRFTSPYMTQRLFYTVDPRYRDGRRSDESKDRGVNVSGFISQNSSRAHLSFMNQVAACDDFEPLYFLGAPITYRSATRNV